MGADERMASSLMKITRSRKHMSDLRAEVQTFFDGKPYEIGTRRDPATRRLIYYVASAKDAPIVISAIVGDVLQNLRSALDHLAFQLYVIGTGRTSGARHVYFPVADDAARYKTESRKKTEGMRQDAIAALASLEPYKGGKGNGLWRLHRLNNEDKHRLLIAVGSAYRAVGLPIPKLIHEFAPGVEWPRLFLKPEDRLFPLKAGHELFIDLPDAEPQSIPFAFELAWGEPEIAEGEPLVDLLQETVSLVETTVISMKSFLD